MRPQGASPGLCGRSGRQRYRAVPGCPDQASEPRRFRCSWARGPQLTARQLRNIPPGRENWPQPPAPPLAVGRPFPMAAWSRQAVLTLYRALLREGRGLRYTDRDFYLASIRREFRKNRGLQRLEDKERQLEKGQAFLQSKLGGLV